MVMTPPTSSESSAPGSPANSSGIIPGVPRAEFYARPNSHPFQNRILLFTGSDQQIKVGRSVARSKPATNNGIFDCKVLSRNHAVMWYENGKFYLQDTKSSNGTFVNNQRLSKGSEESLPREVCSGDILQFGVDVVENARKVTHGCIIATIKLYLPDGKEAKASPTIVTSGSTSSLPTQDLYQLHHYIQEALAREQLLENKLALLQRLVGQTETASSDAWKSLIDEDRLLTRVEILESQLSTYGKGVNEDKLREETIRLMEEKERYQETAKDALKKLVDEKLDTEKRLSDLERSLSNTEDEFSSLKELYDAEVEENRRLADEIARLTAELEAKLAKEEDEEEAKDAASAAAALTSNDLEDFDSKALGEDEIQGAALSGDPFDDNARSVDTMTMSGNVDDEDTSEKTQNEVKLQFEIATLKDKLSFLCEELSDAQRNYEEATLMGQSYHDELEETKQRLKEALELLDSKDKFLDEMESQQRSLGQVAVAATDSGTMTSLVDSVVDNNEETLRRSDATLTASERETLLSMRQQMSELVSLSEETERLRAELEASKAATTKVNQLEADLIAAELKIAELLRVKEKFAEVSEEKLNQTMSLNELEEQVETLSFQSRIATCLAIFPLFILCLAIVIAYLPTVSSVFGTADKL